MATKKKTATAAKPAAKPAAKITEPTTADVQPIEQSAVEPDATEASSDAAETKTAAAPEPEKAQADAKRPDPTVGTQFMELISRDAAGSKIEAMKVGQLGVIVVIGFMPVFVPGADIVDRGNGKQIV